MAEQFGDKRHDPTPLRRQKARQEGHVAKSQDLASAILLLAALVALLWLGGGVTAWLRSLTEESLGGDAWLSADREEAAGKIYTILWGLGAVLLPILGVMFLAALAANMGQVGLLFLPQKLGFDASRVNPLSGFQRVFNVAGAVRLGLGLLKLAIVAAVAFVSLWSDRDAILALTALSGPEIFAFIADITIWTCLKIGGALLLLAIIDYAWQKWRHEQQLRMTDQELREELKQQQGDPQIAARRRAVQRQLVMNRLSSAVPRADVVVTNPTELAIAIQYDIETMPAPVVVAKGAGVLAARIRRLALEHGIPIVERKELARALYKDVDVNRPIPNEQYAAVAQVLRYVYELKGIPLPTLESARGSPG